jgi:hypothetical protein
VSRPVLRGLTIADDPATWAALGFAVDGDRLAVGGIEIRLLGAGAGEGMTGVVIEDGAVDDPPSGAHPNGVTAVDHIVAVTGDFEAAMATYAEAGLEARRIREVPNSDTRQAFYVLGTALLELAGPVAGEGEPRYWGITFVAGDLDALAAQLGERLGAIRDAVQPGRRIATLRREAGSSVPIAFMTPR